MPGQQCQPASGPDPARLAAFQVLHSVFEKNAYANLSSLHVLERNDLAARDRGFASAMIYGTISRVFSIDYLLTQVSSRSTAKLQPRVRTILRLGVWQLYWSGSVPASAAVNESVKLAHHLTRGGAPGLVNAVLRRLDRERPALPQNKPPVLYSLPPELYGYLKKWYPDETAELAASFLREQKTVSARVNTCRQNPAALTARLQDEGLDVVPGRLCPEALQINLAGSAVRGLTAWQQGSLMIQDEAAMLAAYAVAGQPGQTIIDLCAAPGGKTCHLAEKTENRAAILAFDQHPHRLKLLEENIMRMGHQSICCRIGDATGLGMEPALRESADRVLLDVPCSGLGLLARKPEIRLTMTHQRMLELYPLQQKMLAYAASLVKPGGSLVYSTCTINPAENIEAVQAFCADNPNQFTLEDMSSDIPEAVLAFPDLAVQARQGYLQLLPHRHGCDGFFLARLRRSAGAATSQEMS